MQRRVYSLLVDNTAGVLSRVAGLFSRRAYNIDSLTVGETANPKYSRMTVVAKGAATELRQIQRQLQKLVDVVDIKVLESDISVIRELILVKVKVNKEQRDEVISISNIFRANIIDVNKESLVVELTGEQSKLEAFLKMLDGIEILEIARTGATGLSRGSDNIKFLD